MTPNLPEAEALTRRPVGTLERGARRGEGHRATWGRAVLVKGGHLTGDACDVLCFDGRLIELSTRRGSTRRTPTAPAAPTRRPSPPGLARGVALPEAVERAKAWLTEAIGPPPKVGKGIGPVNHFAPSPYDGTA